MKKSKIKLFFGKISNFICFHYTKYKQHKKVTKKQKNIFGRSLIWKYPIVRWLVKVKLKSDELYPSMSLLVATGPGALTLNFKWDFFFQKLHELIVRVPGNNFGE